MNDASQWRLALARSLAPDDLSMRLRRVFRAEAHAGAVELNALIEETITLVEQHLPEVDTVSVRARLRKPRPVRDGPPGSQ